MTRKIKKQNNTLSIVLLQIIIICVGIFFAVFTSFYSLLIAFIAVLLTKGICTYDYKCSNCGSVTGEDSEFCHNCKDVF